MDCKLLAHDIREIARHARSYCHFAGIFLDDGECLKISCSDCKKKVYGTLADIIESADGAGVPDGIEWPRYEDGEPVGIGDVVQIAGEKSAVKGMLFNDSVCILSGANGKHEKVSYAKRVKRPATEVLDADGVPIRVGDVVYRCWDIACKAEKVINAPETGYIELSRFDGDVSSYACPFELTHIRPAVGADLRRIKKGHTVWHKDGKFGPRTVESFDVHDFKTVAIFESDGTALLGCECGQLTHKEPAIGADGLPILEGETTWYTNSGREMKVDAIEHRPEGWWAISRFPDGSKKDSAPVTVLTHTKPVIGADGLPIKKGDTVYATIDGGPYKVVQVDEMDGVTVDAFPDMKMHCSMFTHTKPETSDSWERLEDDAYSMLDDGLHPNDEWVLDILSRAKALAEKEDRSDA